MLDNSDEYDDVDTVTVIESAYRPFLGSATTYTVAVYTLDQPGTDAQWAYSKSKAAKDETMTRAATAVYVVNEKTGEVLEFSLQPAQ